VVHIDKSNRGLGSESAKDLTGQPAQPRRKLPLTAEMAEKLTQPFKMGHPRNSVQCCGIPQGTHKEYAWQNPCCRTSKADPWDVGVRAGFDARRVYVAVDTIFVSAGVRPRQNVPVLSVHSSRAVFDSGPS